ncbi:MAG: hypothetical protein ACRYHQ_19500 [Janthinobacterium lividum]
MSGSDADTAGESITVAEGDVAPAKPRRPRPKPARKARSIATAEALSVGGTEATAELHGLRRSVDQLVQGLGAMLEIQATHTEMVRQLLAAATVPVEPEHRVALQLDRVVNLLDIQGSRLSDIGAALRGLPAEVGAAVAGEVVSALNKVQ